MALFGWLRSKDTLLVKAAGKGNLEGVKKLLKKGANVNAIGKSAGITSLMGASLPGYLEIVKLLVAADADVNATNV